METVAQTSSLSPSRPFSQARLGRAGTTRLGKALVLVALVLAASAFRSARLEAGGLLVHPVNIASAVLFVFALPKIVRIPRRVLLTIAVFTFLFVLSTVQEPRGWGFALKVLSSVLIVIAAAASVQNDSDFRAVAVAFAVVACIVGVRGLLLGSAGVHGINPMEGIANKNGYSLFALPALLLAVFLILAPETPQMTRFLTIGLSLLLVFTIFSTANRSGWLGVVAIAAIVSIRAIRSIKSFLLWAILVSSGVFLVSAYADQKVIHDRVEKTQVDFGQKRLRLAQRAFDVGLENPLLGASPQRLPLEMASRTNVRGIVYDSHNAFALLFGGSGVFTFLALFAMGAAMWWRPKGKLAKPTIDAHFFLRAMVVLWFIRAQSTAEILYSPAFSLAVGVCLGLCAARGLWARPTPAAAR